MQDLIMKMIDQEFDIVQADQLTMAQFALLFRRFGSATHQRPSIVFDAHNAVYEIVARARLAAPFFLRPALMQEAHRLRVYEGSLIHQFDRTLAVSEVDKSALLSAAAELPRTKPDLIQTPDNMENLATKISVIPIAVDSETLQPIKRCESSCNIITVSTLFYPPNSDGVRWFARQVFPLVRRQVPDAHLTIVGPRPPRDLVDYGKRHADFVHVTGYVPDLLPYLERASLMIVPVRVGSGMRVRILEAMARGLAIVSTTTGAEGIDVVSGEHLLIADKPAEFADAVARLLKDRALAESLSKNGRRLAAQKYDWRVVLPRLEHVYEAIGSK
jgi:glycosyltransferase involved in cell wall biosynthesis